MEGIIFLKPGLQSGEECVMTQNRGKLTREDLPVIEALATAIIGVILAIVAVVFRSRERKKERQFLGSNEDQSLLR